MPAPSPIRPPARARRRSIKRLVRVRTRGSCGHRVRSDRTFGTFTSASATDDAVLEERVAALEGCTCWIGVGLRHAAQVVAMHCLIEPGDEWVAAEEPLWGARSISSIKRSRIRLEVVWASPTHIATFRTRGFFSPKTKAISSSRRQYRRRNQNIEAIGKTQERGGSADRR